MQRKPPPAGLPGQKCARRRGGSARNNVPGPAGKYEKNMDDIFETLMNGGNPKLAIRYARRIIKNGEGRTPAEIAPGTKVYELVEELAKYLPEEIKKQFMEG